MQVFYAKFLFTASVSFADTLSLPLRIARSIRCSLKIISGYDIRCERNYICFNACGFTDMYIFASGPACALVAHCNGTKLTNTSIRSLSTDNSQSPTQKYTLSASPQAFTGY